MTYFLTGCRLAVLPVFITVALAHVANAGCHADVAAQLAARYQQMAIWDADRSGTLDPTERASVARAIDGAAAAGGRRPPTERIVERITTLYPLLVPYDADRDGRLNDAETSALTNDLSSGRFATNAGATNEWVLYGILNRWGCARRGP